MKSHLTKKSPRMNRLAGELHWPLKARAQVLLKLFYKGEDRECLQTHEASIILVQKLDKNIAKSSTTV